MILRLKYFGMVAEAIQKMEEELSFTGSSLDELREELLINYPNLAKMNFKFAVNQQISEDNISIKNNDEIALLPPFAGG